MFVISKSDTYAWPVTVEYPVAGGVFKKETFDVEFKRLPQSKIRELRERISTDQITDDLTVARELVAGWKGIVDASGDQIPFSEGALEQVLDVPGVGAAIVTAFFESLQGAKRKN